MEASSLAYIDTVYSADSVEFSHRHPDIFAVGTYQLEKPVEQTAVKESNGSGDESDDGEPTRTPAAKRKGRCLVYRTDGQGMEELQRIEGPAILDMKWKPTSDPSEPSILGIADAEGRLVTHRWDDTLNKLVEVQTLQVTDPKTLVLSLDWSNRVNPASSASLITSLSSMELSHLKYTSTGELEVERTWKAHDFEPWVASWDGWNQNILYSGGDDCKLKAWDVRSAEDDQPIWTNKRFDAGVTCIQTSPHKPNLIAVGSYNETVTLLDPRYPLRPLVDPIPIGGGAWRIKWHPSQSRQNDLLVACMHDGFKVIRLDGSTVERTDQNDGEAEWKLQSLELLTRFDGHESLAYGVDWSSAAVEEGKEGSLVGSASFYDHALHLWRA